MDTGPSSSASRAPDRNREVAGEAPAAGYPRHPRLVILVRKDLSQKSYRMAMAIHAAVLHTHWQSMVPVHVPDQLFEDWKKFSHQGPIVAVYGVSDEEALLGWKYLLAKDQPDLVLYREPDHGEAAMSLCFYGDLPEDHGLPLL